MSTPHRAVRHQERDRRGGKREVRNAASGGEAYDGGSLGSLDGKTVGLDGDTGTGCVGLLVLALDLDEALVSLFGCSYASPALRCRAVGGETHSGFLGDRHLV